MKKSVAAYLVKEAAKKKKREEKERKEERKPRYTWGRSVSLPHRVQHSSRPVSMFYHLEVLLSYRVTLLAGHNVLWEGDLISLERGVVLPPGMEVKAGHELSLMVTTEGLEGTPEELTRRVMNGTRILLWAIS